MSSCNRRLILTGATGFIGTHIVPALKAHGFEIHALGRKYPSQKVAFHQIDLLDARSVQAAIAKIEASHLLHLAWYTEPSLYWQSPANIEWAAASLNLVRTFHEAGGSRAVAAGTCAEYAWGLSPLRENECCTPSTLYGAAKDGTHRILAAYARETGLSFAWGRVFFLYGPGEKSGRLVSDAIRTLASGKRFAASAGHQRRDFSHVADVASAFAALANSNVIGPVNIGSGIAVPISFIINRIGELLGKAELIDFGARELAKDDPVIIEADVSRLRSKVGFIPFYNLDSGIAETVAMTVLK